MALQEEYEYAAFRCAFCNFFNPAKKLRPMAPRLPDMAMPMPSLNVQRPSSSTSESSSGNFVCAVMCVVVLSLGEWTFTFSCISQSPLFFCRLGQWDFKDETIKCSRVERAENDKRSEASEWSRLGVGCRWYGDHWEAWTDRYWEETRVDFSCHWELENPSHNHREEKREDHSSQKSYTRSCCQKQAEMNVNCQFIFFQFSDFPFSLVPHELLIDFLSLLIFSSDDFLVRKDFMRFFSCFDTATTAVKFLFWGMKFVAGRNSLWFSLNLSDWLMSRDQTFVVDCKVFWLISDFDRIWIKNIYFSEKVNLDLVAFNSILIIYFTHTQTK